MCSSSAVSGEGSRDELRYWKQTCCCFAMVRSPSFGGVVKQVRLGLCTDGMGPPRAESVLEPVVLFHNSGYPRVSNGTDLPMLGLSSRPLLRRASDGLYGRWHTPAGHRDGQTTHSYAQMTGWWVGTVCWYVCMCVGRYVVQTELTDCLHRGSRLPLRYGGGRSGAGRSPSCRSSESLCLGPWRPRGTLRTRIGRGMCRFDGPILVSLRLARSSRRLPNHLHRRFRRGVSLWPPWAGA